MKNMNEKDWVKDNLTGRTDYWDELLRSGRATIEDLKDGELKTLIHQFLNVDSDLTSYLIMLGYEAG